MSAAERLTVAEGLCRALVRQGVDMVFGHPGGAILPFYDALFREGRPRHVLVRHEQAAAHAADGYARVTGRVGVCVATSGPGATNLVTGLGTALMDSVPLVAITGQVPSGAMGTEAFQETDILGVTMSVTKHGFLLDDPASLPDVVEEAFRLARSGRPGPVLIDVPKDVLAAELPDPAPAARAAGQIEGDPAVAGGSARNGSSADTSDALDRAARLLASATRPVVLAGRGVVLSGTHDILARLVRRADLPVSPTLLGLDAFPATDPRCIGMPGMHGSERANRAIQAADVILGLGLRFDDRVTGARDRFAPRASIIHMDIDPISVGRTVRPEVAVMGDLSDTLRGLLRRTPATRRRTWWSTLRSWAREAEPHRREAEPPSGPLSGRMAIRALAGRIGRDRAAVVTDVGQHQMWLAQELGAAPPGTHLTSGGLGTMGYALPAGIGAALGRGSQGPVWVIAGDGGFQMTLQELATVVQERIPLRIAVINNGFLGMVRQWQELFYERRYAATDLSGPDLVALAAAYGVAGRAVDRAEELDAALDWAGDEPGPVLLDLRVVREENVYPIVPAGAALDELVAAPHPAQT